MVKVLPKTKRKNRPPTNSLIPFCLHNRSFTYRKLPEQLLKLSVLKLDGSSFSFHVERNATVGGVKLAIEEEFSLFPKDEREKLWTLVWSHFCLCFEGHKLIHDTACIQKYGIKDGDQLHFVQHLQIDLSPTPQQSKNQSVELKQHPVTSARNARAKDGVTVEDEYGELEYLHCEEESGFPETKSRLTHSLKELLSCSKFSTRETKCMGRMNGP